MAMGRAAHRAVAASGATTRSRACCKTRPAGCRRSPHSRVNGLFRGPPRGALGTGLISLDPAPLRAPPRSAWPFNCGRWTSKDADRGKSATHSQRTRQSSQTCSRQLSPAPAGCRGETCRASSAPGKRCSTAHLRPFHPSTALTRPALGTGLISLAPPQIARDWSHLASPPSDRGREAGVWFRPPSLRTGQADFPHPALQSVGSLQRLTR